MINNFSYIELIIDIEERSCNRPIKSSVRPHIYLKLLVNLINRRKMRKVKRSLPSRPNYSMEEAINTNSLKTVSSKKKNEGLMMQILKAKQMFLIQKQGYLMRF